MSWTAGGVGTGGDLEDDGVRIYDVYYNNLLLIHDAQVSGSLVEYISGCGPFWEEFTDDGIPNSESTIDIGVLWSLDYTVLSDGFELRADYDVYGYENAYVQIWRFHRDGRLDALMEMNLNFFFPDCELEHFHTVFWRIDTAMEGQGDERFSSFGTTWSEQTAEVTSVNDGFYDSRNYGAEWRVTDDFDNSHIFFVLENYDKTPDFAAGEENKVYVLQNKCPAGNPDNCGDPHISETEPCTPHFPSPFDCHIDEWDNPPELFPVTGADVVTWYTSKIHHPLIHSGTGIITFGPTLYLRTFLSQGQAYTCDVVIDRVIYVPDFAAVDDQEDCDHGNGHNMLVTALTSSLTWWLWYGGTSLSGSVTAGSPRVVVFPHYNSFFFSLWSKSSVSTTGGRVSVFCNENNGILKCAEFDGGFHGSGSSPAKNMFEVPGFARLQTTSSSTMTVHSLGPWVEWSRWSPLSGYLPGVVTPFGSSSVPTPSNEPYFVTLWRFPSWQGWAFCYSAPPEHDCSAVTGGSWANLHDTVLDILLDVPGFGGVSDLEAGQEWDPVPHVLEVYQNACATVEYAVWFSTYIKEYVTCPTYYAQFILPHYRSGIIIIARYAKIGLLLCHENDSYVGCFTVSW